ncbi:hypothetical protein U1Q18_046208 [Sarracenia purpurea var. burkii]
MNLWRKADRQVQRFARFRLEWISLSDPVYDSVWACGVARDGGAVASAVEQWEAQRRGDGRSVAGDGRSVADLVAAGEGDDVDGVEVLDGDGGEEEAGVARRPWELG